MKVKMVKEEQELLNSYERGEWVPVKNLAARKAELRKYARNTLKKDKRLGALETLEIKSDKKVLHSILRAEKDILAGKVFSHTDIFKKNKKNKKKRN